MTPGNCIVGDRFPQVDIDDAVGRLAELHLDRRRLEAGEAAAEHLGVEAELADRTQDADRVRRIRGDVDQIRLRGLHGANNRREVDRGRRIGSVVHDVDLFRLGMPARTSDYCRRR